MVGEGEGRCIAIDTYGTYNDGQPGREAGVVCQIFRRCHEPSESQPPAIMSAFARSSIPGYVFIEAYNVGKVRHAVDGFVTVRRDMQPHFIVPTVRWITLPGYSFILSGKGWSMGALYSWTIP